jgi:hypothetical protein
VLATKKRLTKHRDILSKTSSGVGDYEIISCPDLLSTNLLVVEADRDYRFADRALNLDDALHCIWICVKQPLILATRTSHMHFMHSFSPPVRGQSKGNLSG